MSATKIQKTNVITQMKQQLKDFLKDGKAWEKMDTELPGVFVVRVPGPKSNREKGARLMIEVNPVNEAGKPYKRKGLFLANREIYYKFLEILEDDRVNKILMTLEEVNPTKKKSKRKKLKLS